MKTKTRKSYLFFDFRPLVVNNSQKSKPVSEYTFNNRLLPCLLAGCMGALLTRTQAGSLALSNPKLLSIQ
jgi:hypothetical protein